MSATTLTVAQEAEAQQLVQRIQEVAREDLVALARLLVSKPEAETFGQTEFQARDIIHRVAAKAFETHLAQKKTVTAAPASPAPTANRPLSSRATGKELP